MTRSIRLNATTSDSAVVPWLTVTSAQTNRRGRRRAALGCRARQCYYSLPAPQEDQVIALPDEVEVCIEIPRGGWIKRRHDGSVDFLSPVPCPFNYGSVPGSVAPDGDPLDAIVLGPTVGRGRTARWPVWGRVDFVDDGRDDPKLVCGPERPTEAQWAMIRRFFLLYTWAKRVRGWARGQRGWTGVRT